jgi:hypothetical protein
MIKSAIHKSFRFFGLDIIHFPPREQEQPADFLPNELEIIRAVRPWTLTSVERIYALVRAIKYTSARGMAGKKETRKTGNEVHRTLAGAGQKEFIG